MNIQDQHGNPINTAYFEKPEQDLANQYIKEDDVVLELGARYGSVSCVINSKLKCKTNQVVVEPDVRVWDALERNKVVNGCGFHIVKGFVSPKKLGLTNLDNWYGGYGATYVVDDSSSVPSYTLETVEEMYRLKFNVLVADCEGGLELFLDENPTLLPSLRLVIFEADYPNKCDYTKIRKNLKDLGFRELLNGHQNVWIRSPPPTLCLNMIVKNESKIIERLIRSVLPIIDSYCICDTGSTDDTVKIIDRVMKEAGKTGVVLHEPFKNFGYNRTFALEAAKDYGDYALLLDADFKLVITPEFKKEDLVDNGYYVLQKNRNLQYYNTRIVKTGVGVKCIGPTHEYYDVSSRTKLTTLWIEDIGDGGAKADKFERDIRLLKAGLEEDPKNARYHFYLAQSYKDIGDLGNAIVYYIRRVELGGWIEEVFYSCYEVGNAYKRLNLMPNALHWWLEAYNRHPSRAESLYEIIRYYRECNKIPVAKLFWEVARKIPYPAKDVLFIKEAVYTELSKLVL